MSRQATYRSKAYRAYWRARWRNNTPLLLWMIWIQQGENSSPEVKEVMRLWEALPPAKPYNRNIRRYDLEPEVVAFWDFIASTGLDQIGVLHNTERSLDRVITCAEGEASERQ